MKKSAIAFAASMLGQVCATAEPMPSLGMTRPELWAAVEATFPKINVPAMACGRPLIIKGCSEAVTDRLRVWITETQRSSEHVAAFIRGDPGLVFAAGATIRIPDESLADFPLFFAYCAAFLVASGRAEDAGAAFRLITKQLEMATDDAYRGAGIAIDGQEPLIFAVEVAPRENIVCRISAQ